MIIWLRAADRTLLYEGEVVDLVFPEPLILQKSVEFFGDEAPCMIHRSAVRSRLCMEIEEAVHAAPDGVEVPPHLRVYLSYYPGAATMGGAQCKGAPSTPGDRGARRAWRLFGLRR